MNNADVNAVVLRLARTLQRCGEDPRVVFAALVGSAATLAADIGFEVNHPADFRRAIDSVVASGHLDAFADETPATTAAVLPFRPALVA